MATVSARSHPQRRPFSPCELGRRRDVRYRPRGMAAQAAVTRLAAEPSEVRVWPRSEGIMLACRIRTRIPDGFWHRSRSQA
jgi:hypothetical protein